MKRIIQVLLIQLLFVILSQMAFSNHTIDSLRNLLSNSQAKEKVDLLNEIAVEYRDIDNTEYLKYSTKALELSKILNYKKGIAEALMNTGIYNSIIGQHEIAKINLLAALDIFIDLGDRSGEAKVYANLGLINKFQNNLSEALINLKKAIDLNTKLKDGINLSKSLVNIGVLYYNYGQYSKALDYYLKALTIKRRLKDDKGIGLIYNNLGQIYFNWTKFNNSLNYFKKAGDLFIKLHDKKNLAMVYNNIASVKLETKDYTLALKYSKLSLEIKRELNYQNGIAVSFLNIAQILLLNNDNDNAKAYIDSSFSIFHSIQDSSSLAECYKISAKINLNKKEYDKAVKNLEYAILNYKNNNMTVELASCYHLLAETYHKIGNDNKAYINHQLYAELNESINNLNQKSMIEAVTMSLEADNKMQILSKNNELQKANSKFLLSTIIFSAMILIALIASVIFFIIQNKKLKNNLNKLEEMNRFQMDTYNSLTNNIISALYPLSINIAKINDDAQYQVLNKSYLGLSKEFESIVRSFQNRLNN